MNKEMIHRDTAYDQKMHYSQGVKIGPTIYVSGQVALDDDGRCGQGHDLYYATNVGNGFLLRRSFRRVLST